MVLFVFAEMPTVNHQRRFDWATEQIKSMLRLLRDFQGLGGGASATRSGKDRSKNLRAALGEMRWQAASAKRSASARFCLREIEKCSDRTRKLTRSQTDHIALRVTGKV